MTCRHVARDQPRLLTGRHVDDCDDSLCVGCQPCSEHHCAGRPRCGVHVPTGVLVCGDCLARTRADLAAIVDLHARMPDEAAEQGVDSEAADLAGPAADPARWAERRLADRADITARWEAGDLSDTQAVAALERLPEDDAEHPYALLGRWDLLLREDYGPPTRLRVTVDRAADYLDSILHRVAQDPEQDYPLLASELRGCRVHLEAVLREGEQVETGAPCLRCETLLRRVWGTGDDEDGWWCPRCRHHVTHEEYRRAVAQVHMAHAEWLPAATMVIRADVTPWQLRQWAARDQVRTHLEGGRTVYSVDDVTHRVALGRAS